MMIRFFKLILVALFYVCCAHVDGAQLVRPFVLVKHDAFISYYDLDTHRPAMVTYQLVLSHFAGNAKIAGRHFKMDAQLPRPRVKDTMFNRSGYVRGHLCSAADRDSNKAWLKQTYLTSNLVPMTMVCNSGAWKVVEDSCRWYAAHGHRLQVSRGCLDRLCLNGESVSKANFIYGGFIRVPDAFFCAMHCLDCPLKKWWVVTNEFYSQSSYVTTSILEYVFDSRIDILLTNIHGLWCREEYATTTH